MKRVVRAVYEDGVLKPLGRVRIDTTEGVPRLDLSRGRVAEGLRGACSSASTGGPDAALPRMIEEDVTAAHAEVRTKRRETRRSA